MFGGAHVLTVPLVARDKAVGAVTLRRNDRAFTQEEINLADTLASATGGLLCEKWALDRPLPALAADRVGAFLAGCSARTACSSSSR